MPKWPGTPPVRGYLVCVDCNEEAHLVAQMAGQTKRRKHVCQHSILLFNIEHSVTQMDWRASGARVPRVPLGLDVVDRSRTSTLIVPRKRMFT
jgi:hypothetical protein